MQQLDLSLLPALDALLREESVTGAAARMHVSPPAMSRTLGRLRRALGDPLLVPAGRGLVPTARALELRPEVAAAMAAAVAVLQPASGADWRALPRTFALRANESVVALLGAELVARSRSEAPGLLLRFLPEGDEDPLDLRDAVDLDIGVQPALPPDVRREHLLDDSFVMVGTGLPKTLRMKDFLARPHVVSSRRGRARGPVDVLLAEQGLSREIAAVTPSPTAACLLAVQSDAIALVPSSVSGLAESLGLTVRPVPLDLPTMPIEQIWHLRHDHDPAHRWLRAAVRDAVAAQPRRAR